MQQVETSFSFFHKPHCHGTYCCSIRIGRSFIVSCPKRFCLLYLHLPIFALGYIITIIAVLFYLQAIECSHNGCIELLLDHNADVNVTDVNASSTLHLAAANNLIDIATLLLRKGMNINISDKVQHVLISCYYIVSSISC